MQAGKIDIPNTCVICHANLNSDSAKTCGEKCRKEFRRCMSDKVDKLLAQMQCLNMGDPMLALIEAIREEARDQNLAVLRLVNRLVEKLGENEHGQDR